MRIAIIDESAALAAVIAEGLVASELSDITILVERQGLVARIQELSPDVVLIPPQADRGPIICVCFDVGMATILDTIRADTLITVEAVGAALNARTNCGSCRPAIARLLQTERQTEYI